jgi:hypothetical protein
MFIQTCRKCGHVIDENNDRTICGYGRCMKCCAETCGHRQHLNPKVQEKMREVNKQVGDFFNKLVK